ncbi:MAG: N-acetylneuraminate synthase [Bacteroidales bacterium]|jgi:N,N'-diacetyllegionaminate synthase|nr:N-acetylneuraminate synthase [Bacteroidales bacterium]
MNKTIIIAEAGVNHNGSIDMAKQLISIAAEAGVDYVKFQTFKADNLVSENAVKADYQTRTTDKNESQLEMLKKLQLSQEQHYELIEYCKSKNTKFLSTAFDLDSIEFLSALNLGLWKIPSGEITNYPYLKTIAEKNEPVLMSTGMSSLDDIEQAINVLVDNGLSREKITVLHCNTEYPTPMEDVNLLAMNTIKNIFNVKIGYSDHTEGIEIPIAAVALGATVIEKHITLDRNLPGPDHKASIEPDELKAMVKAIRNIEKALGSPDKVVSSSEEKNITVARKSIVAKRNIAKGEKFTGDNITTKRPGSGISPMRWNEVLGMTAIKDFQKDDLIEL